MMNKTRYVITYEIRTKGTTAIRETNEFIYEASVTEFSLLQVKAIVLKLHGFDETMHYVVIRGVFPLVDEKTLLTHLTNTTNQVILEE